MFCLLNYFGSNFDILTEQFNGTNECNTSSSNEPTPPDNLAVNHKAKLTASKSAPPLQDNVKTDFYSDQRTTDSPTKCILNNQKMEERKQ